MTFMQSCKQAIVTKAIGQTEESPARIKARVNEVDLEHATTQEG